LFVFLTVEAGRMTMEAVSYSLRHTVFSGVMLIRQKHKLNIITTYLPQPTNHWHQSILILSWNTSHYFFLNDHLFFLEISLWNKRVKKKIGLVHATRSGESTDGLMLPAVLHPFRDPISGVPQDRRHIGYTALHERMAAVERSEVWVLRFLRLRMSLFDCWKRVTAAVWPVF
jgi:hypothetical protein